MKIRLEPTDWLFNAGLAGILNIFDDARIPFEVNEREVNFSSEALEKFNEYYFSYFIKKYKSFTSWYKITSFKTKLQALLIDEEITDKKLEELNKYIENTKKYITSNSYKNTYHLIKNGKKLAEYGAQLKKITLTKKQTIDEVKETIQQTINICLQIIDILSEEDCKRYILARNIIYDVIDKFWGGVSFLHTSANKKDMYEEYNNYFIKPVFSYLEEMQEEKKYYNYKYQCFSCDNKYNKIGSAYELTWISKTGVDSARKSSHFWNYTSDAYVCPICNFVYSCVPAGFSFLKGKGLFINDNTNLRTLVSMNRLALDKVKTFEELEDRSYYLIVDALHQTDITHLKKEIENIQMVKIDAQHAARPYTFNVLSKNRLQLITANKKYLDYLAKAPAIYDQGDWIHLYHEVIKRIYDNKNLFDLIYKLFHLSQNDKLHNLTLIRYVLHINHHLIKGGKNVASFYKIKQFQLYGMALRYEYTEQANKLPGITYRLLNALKVKNTARFMDTLLNAYMYKNKQIPLDFVSALTNEEEFQTIGYAFLLGLQGEKGELENHKDKKEVQVND